MILEILNLLDGVWLLFCHITSRSSFPLPLRKSEEAELLARMQKGDKTAEKELIEHNLRLVAHIAKKYQRTGIDTDDLVSIGAIGLMKAVHTFRPEAGKLTTYASRCIENEILMALRAGKKSRQDVSLNDPLSTGSDDGEAEWMDMMGTREDLVPWEAETRIEYRRALSAISRVLSPDERKVIHLRYGIESGEPLTQREVAEKLKISRSYVSRIEKRALQRLRDALCGCDEVPKCP